MPTPIDLRSDTVTQPTQAMREAMFSCEVGDDVLGEDPTINKLENEAAELLGKEAALFIPSGTFGNQCAILTHTHSGNEVILSESSHIVQHEAGASALISRVQLRSVLPENGRYLKPDDIFPRLRSGDDIHYPRTGLICLEQATAMGNVMPMSALADLHSLADEHDVPIHIDGARFFNAATALDVDPAEMANYADSITFCLSKGLAAPVGSILVGTRSFIDQARRNRKIMGGGMRQAGFMAAAGRLAIHDMRLRLKDDHRHAHLLAESLSAVPGARVTRPVEINMVFVQLQTGKLSDDNFVARLQAEGVLTYPPEGGEYRFVTHAGISEADIQHAAATIRRILDEVSAK